MLNMPLVAVCEKLEVQSKVVLMQEAEKKPHNKADSSERSQKL